MGGMVGENLTGAAGAGAGAVASWWRARDAAMGEAARATGGWRRLGWCPGTWAVGD